MCRAMTGGNGRRCSGHGANRLIKAIKNDQKIVREISEFKKEHPNRVVPKRMRTKEANSISRTNAAYRTYYMTNVGMRDLDNQINESVAAAEKARRSKKKNCGVVAREHNKRANVAQGIKNEMLQLRDSASHGSALMAPLAYDKDGKAITDPTTGKHLNMRQATQLWMRANGCQVRETGQYISQEQAEKQVKELSEKYAKAGMKPQKPVLNEWDEKDLRKHAKNWIDHSSSGVWKDSAAMPKGKGLEKVSPSRTKIFKLTSPDGSLSEVKTDMHVVKNKEGKYFVQTRRTIAMTNIQTAAKQIHGFDTGEMIKHKVGIIEDREVIDEQSFSSAKEAEAYRKKQVRRLNAHNASDVAVLSRKAHVRRMEKNLPLMPQKESGQFSYSPTAARVENNAPKRKEYKAPSSEFLATASNSDEWTAREGYNVNSVDAEEMIKMNEEARRQERNKKARERRKNKKTAKK